jgi:hypothetical protein
VTDAAALRRCVGNVDDFFKQYWGREPLLRRADGSNFDDLASFEDLDRMVSSLGLKAGNLRMVRDGETLAPSAYTSQPSGKRVSEPLVIPALVCERYAEGATIVLESLQRYWAPLTDFCRDLELALGHRLQVNAYLTPPGSQGFDVHRDDHDVFVLQVWGEKQWTVFDLESESALIDEPITKDSALYIPKGFPHSARTGEMASAHLTVGILTHEPIDIIKEIAKLAEKEPIFQERLTLEDTSTPEGLRRSVESSVGEFQAWLDKVDIDELTQRVARRVKGSSLPLLRGQLRQLELVDALDETSVVALRRGTMCFLVTGDSHLTVTLIDRELQMPLSVDPAMQRIAKSDRILVSNLHDLLDPESALVLVKRLIREGLLEVVVGD